MPLYQHFCAAYGRLASLDSQESHLEYQIFADLL